MAKKLLLDAASEKATSFRLRRELALPLMGSAHQLAAAVEESSREMDLK